jgi:thermostable 8-oxoguanine DNA glycosylase
MRVSEWPGDLTEFLSDYRYQSDLTRRLDAVGTAAFDQSLVNEIVLWKVNRYAPLEPDALAALNSAVQIEPGEHRTAHNVLAILLRQQGVDLPMASTLLRFRKPTTFQIIDRHAYRAVAGVDYPLLPSDEQKTDLYFQYLDALVRLGQESGVSFQTLDRILYVFDKQKNGRL